MYYIFFFKQKTAYEMRISDWSSDVCSSDLRINVTKIWQGLKAAQGGGPESALAKDMARALRDTRRPVTFILAERDNTAVAFEDAWNRPAFQHLRESERVRLVIITKIGRAHV